MGWSLSQVGAQVTAHSFHHSSSPEPIQSGQSIQSIQQNSTSLTHTSIAAETSASPWSQSTVYGPAQKSEERPTITTTTDPVPPRLELGHHLYLETCATCHVGVPPAVLPQQSWINVIQDTEHYGVQLPPLVDPNRLLIWQYLEQFSRSLQEEENTPYYIRNSRFFTALHPRVEFEQPIRLNGCVSCHPGAPAFNYRRLTPDWRDAP